MHLSKLRLGVVGVACAMVAWGEASGKVGPPPNNDCSNAIVIAEGDLPVPFSTINATTDGPGDCATRNDIWYRYQALSVKQVTVSLCGSDYDTHLSVYEGGTCPPTVLLDCNDDSFACTSIVHSQVVFLSVAGAEYLIRVGGFFFDTGTGTMTVTTVDPPGIIDECPQALEIFDGPRSFSTVGATDSEPPLPEACREFGSLNFGADIWYTYVATCDGMLTINQCDINFDGRMAAYRGHNCPPDDADLAGCNDDACGGASGAIMTINVICGELLTLRVGGWGGAEFGTGTLVLTCDGSPCPGDSDDDGVPDDEDACLESILTPTIVIDDCDSGVGNLLFEDGCTMADLIAECAEGAVNHGQFVSCVAHLTNDWKHAGLINGREKGRIQSCAARSNTPGDLDGDGAVGVSDLVMLLGKWGPCPAQPDACPGDVDLDDIVGITDLLILLGNWG